MPTPKSVTVRSYNVGFGDCFVVIFEYAEASESDRHILIDIGSTRLPGAGNPARRPLADIAKDIRDRSDRQLEMVVATHRHADHISGFSGKAGSFIAEARPRIIVQPWTENPDLAEDAVEPDSPEEKRLHFVGSLASMDQVAQYVHAITNLTKDSSAATRRTTSGMSKRAKQQLAFLGETNIKNKKAVIGLQDMADAIGGGTYVKAGDSLTNEEILLA